MGDSRTQPTQINDAPRALVIAPSALQRRHADALTAHGARLLAMTDADGLADTLTQLIAADLIVFDGSGLSPGIAASCAERTLNWVQDSSCRLIALLDHGALDLVAFPFLDAGAMLLCQADAVDYAAALSHCTQPPGARLHDATQEREVDRLRHLNAEVARLAAVLSDFAADPVRSEVRETAMSFRSEAAEDTEPTARSVRALIRSRRLRDQFFVAELFADPAWDMLLDLYAARLERTQVSVSSLCIAAAVPPTTALRWIGTMHDAGLFERAPDPDDRRRAHITLSARATDAMRAYFIHAARQGLPAA